MRVCWVSFSVIVMVMESSFRRERFLGLGLEVHVGDYAVGPGLQVGV